MAFTYFFRDMQTLETIKDYLLSQLRCRRFINIWDAGCAMGPEPYSLAIVLRENVSQMYFRNIKIKATDVDQSNLFKGIIETAEYSKEQIERIPKDILVKYFREDDTNKQFRIIDEIRKSVVFTKHDLLSLKPIGNNFDLIMCKNVLLHFNDEQRIKVIKMFYDSLLSGGFFATEQTQKIPKELEGLFEPVASNVQLFKKVG